MEINVDGENGSILVEGKVEEDTMYDKAMVRITKDTKIQKNSMSKLFAISDIEKFIFITFVLYMFLNL